MQRLRPTQCLRPVQGLRPTQCLRPMQRLSPIQRLRPMQRLRPTLCLRPMQGLKPCRDSDPFSDYMRPTPHHSTCTYHLRLRGGGVLHAMGDLVVGEVLLLLPHVDLVVALAPRTATLVVVLLHPAALGGWGCQGKWVESRTGNWTGKTVYVEN